MMCVYHNTGSDGKVYSITRHEPIDPKKGPCIKRKFLGKAAAKGQL